MLNETLASLYEDTRNYTRGTELSTPMVVLSQIMLRYAMENRIGLVLDRNFDLYIQMARNLENPYHLYEKDELVSFFAAIDEALEKDGYEKISDMIDLLPFMYDEKENARYSEILGTKAFRSTYESFVKEDFKDRRNIASLLYTLSYQGRKDWRDKRSYTLGLLLASALGLDNSAIVEDELDNSELMLSAIAITSGCRTATGKDNLPARILSPLCMENRRIEENEKASLLLADTLPEDLEEAFRKTERIAYFAPSALLLSSSRENLETREHLIGSGRIESVIVLPPLTAAVNENITIIILSGELNEKIGFADLNSRGKDRSCFKENQLTESAIEMVTALIRDRKETEGITKIVDAGDVKERRILVPMNYLEGKVEKKKDTEEIEKRIEELYGKLAALMEL